MTTLTSRLGLRILSLLVIALFCAATARAQRVGTGTIYGRVIDAASNKAMPGADISLKGSNILTLSDQGGFFTIQGVPAGEATITVSYPSYVPQPRQVTVEAGKTTPMLEFDMDLVPERKVTGVSVSGNESVVQLEKLTVSSERSGKARAYQLQKNAMNMANIVSTDSFGAVQSGNITDFLKNLPGVQLGIGDSGEANTISVDGLDPENVAVSMDGAPVASGGGDFGSGSRQFQFDQLNIESIEQVSLNRMLTAEMTGDASATVDFKLKSAFDYKSARFTYRTFLNMNSYNMSLGRTPDPMGGGTSRKILPGVALSYLTPFRRNTMGLTINFTTQQDFAQSGQCTTTYVPYGFQVNSPYVGTVSWQISPQLNRRLNTGITYDWRVGPRAKLKIGFVYDLRETTKAVYSTSVRQSTNDYYHTPQSGNTTVVYSNESANAGLQLRGSSSYQTGYTDTINAAFEWKPGRFVFDALAQFSYANNKSFTGEKGFFGSVNMNGVRWHDYYIMKRSSPTSSDWSFWNGAGSILNPTLLAGKPRPASFWPGGYIAPGIYIPEGIRVVATGTGTVSQLYNNANISDIATYGQDGTGALVVPMSTIKIQGTPYLRANLQWSAPTPFQWFFKGGVTGQKVNRNWWTPTNAGGGGLSTAYQFVGPTWKVTDPVTGVVSDARMGDLGSSGANWDTHTNSSPTSGNIAIGDLYPKNWNPAIQGELPIPLLSTPYYVNAYNFNPHLGGNISALSFPFIDRTLLYSIYKAHPEYFNVKGWETGASLNSPNDLNNYIASMTAQKNLSEMTLSGYFMTQIQPIRRLTINFGVRYEYTKQTSDVIIPYTAAQMIAMGYPSNQATDPSSAFEYARIQFKNGVRTHTEASYAYIIPRVFAKYDWTPNLTMNVGYNENYSRVDVSKIAGQWSISGANATTPNPNLEPNKFHSASVALDYLFEPGGSLKLTYVYRFWNGYAYNTIPADSSEALWQSLANQFGSDTMDFYAARPREYTEVLPWSHIDCGVTAEHLIAESRSAREGEASPDCRTACLACGANVLNGGLCDA